MCAWSVTTQSCLNLCNSTGCSAPGSSVHGILQARILEWIAISFSRGSSQSRHQNFTSLRSPSLAGRFFTSVSSGKPIQGKPLNDLVKMKWIRMAVFGGKVDRQAELRQESCWGVNIISTGIFKFSPYCCKIVSDYRFMFCSPFTLMTR